MSDGNRLEADGEKEVQTSMERAIEDRTVRTQGDNVKYSLQVGTLVT